VPYSFLRILGKTSVRDVERDEYTELMVAVMFIDIRGFTTPAEGLGAGGTFSLINRYLAAVEPEIHRIGGHIALGDGILALFPRDADAAVAASIGVRRAVAALNVERHKENAPPIRIGIGVNCGTLMVGTIGGGDQLDAGVVGDPVNLGARVEGMTKMYGAGTLVSSHVHAALVDSTRYQLREIDTVIAKGKTQPIVLFEVLDADPEPIRAGKLETLSVYAAALAAYRRGDFADASAGFTKCLERTPDDGPAKTMYERTAKFARDGGPAAWSGVSVLEQSSSVTPGSTTADRSE